MIIKLIPLILFLAIWHFLIWVKRCRHDWVFDMTIFDKKTYACFQCKKCGIHKRKEMYVPDELRGNRILRVGQYDDEKKFYTKLTSDQEFLNLLRSNCSYDDYAKRNRLALETMDLILSKKSIEIDNITVELIEPNE